ncbi:hypothetical protein VTJ04DRAFT_9846 [Mycothermus thermophilus]|uniref:uncharacterized protein n=1 Tax=Humicola insolens TaxID=85995 RepID=UPI0037436DFC
MVCMSHYPFAHITPRTYQPPRNTQRVLCSSASPHFPNVYIYYLAFLAFLTGLLHIHGQAMYLNSDVNPPPIPLSLIPILSADSRLVLSLSLWHTNQYHPVLQTH